MTITKTIGAAGCDYTTLGDAIDAWEADITDADWVFKVKDGDYTVAADRSITMVPTQADKTLVIQADTGDSTSVHFDGGGSSDRFWIQSTSANFKSLTLRDLRIENFYRTTGDFGGAVCIDTYGQVHAGFTLTIDKCAFISNRITTAASGYGGAVFFRSDNGTFSDTDSTYTSNYTANQSAGACYIRANSVSLTGCQYDQNYAYYYGGAIRFADCGTVTISDCDFGLSDSANPNKTTCLDDNTGGGAICAGLCTAINITGSRFYRNGRYGSVAGTQVGGAIMFFDGGTLNIDTTTFSENYADKGGAIYYTTGKMAINKCKFDINHSLAEYGGAVCIEFSTEGGLNGASAVDIDIVNALFTGNHCTSGSTTGGGAIFIEGDSEAGDSYVVTNCTFSNNEVAAGDGGAILFARSQNSPVLNSYNNIFWANVCASYEDIATSHADCTANIYNCTYQTGEIGGAGTENFTSCITSDPLFTGAGDYTLQVTSPARNVGNNTYISGYTTDLAGNDRTIGTVDMGCYENQTAASLVSYIWGVAFASIAKINGIEIDKIAKVDGVSIKA